MITFQELMHAVHQSIHSAAQAVESAGFKHIDKFFEKVEAEDSNHMQEKSEELNEAIARGDKSKAQALVKELQNSPEDYDHSVGEDGITYRPKMVSMAFPNQGDNGIESTIVNVPLITLCPISSPRIKDVKFSADLEVKEGANDELLVAFQKAKSSGDINTNRKDLANTHIEISLVGHEPSEGLQSIVEGYEKALRAQIPG